MVGDLEKSSFSNIEQMPTISDRFCRIGCKAFYKMINIRRMGINYHHDPDFLIEREHGFDCYLAIYLHSRCLIGTESGIVRCEPGAFVVFDKNSPHYYGADGEEYIEDWIQFECDESCMLGFNIPLNRPIHI